MYHEKEDWEDSGGIDNTVKAEDINRWETGIKQAERGTGICYSASGSGGAHVVSTGQSLTSLGFGFTVRIKPNHTYTGDHSLAIDGLTAIPIYDPGGERVSEMYQGGMYTLTYDTAQQRFFAQGSSGLANYFGDGSSGALTVSTTIPAGSVKNYTHINLPAFQSVDILGQGGTTIIYVDGDMTVGGFIGGIGNGDPLMGAVPNFPIHRKELFGNVQFGKYMELTGDLQMVIGGAGGAGGTGGGSGGGRLGGSGGPGKALRGGFGGGGGGGGNSNGNGGSAQAISRNGYGKGPEGVFSASSTSVAGDPGHEGAGGAGGLNAGVNSGAGKGGDCNGGGGGGGGGMISGYSGSTSGGADGATGVGGFIIFIVRGNVIVTGSIQMNGAPGGDGGTAMTGVNVTDVAGGGGGGGSGGGGTMILHRGTKSIASGSLTGYGGAGGLAGLSTGVAVATNGASGADGFSFTQAI